VNWLLVRLLEQNKMTLADINVKYAVVFQEHRLLPWKRVADNVPLGVTGPDVRERSAAALAEVGLADRGCRWPVDEALLLADRALVLDGGRIAEELPVALDHPRAPDDPGFGPLRRQLLDRLGVPLHRG